MSVRPVTAVPRADPGATAGEARTALLGRSFASAADLAVCEGDRVLGIVPIEQLLAADAQKPVGELLEAPNIVDADTDEELAAYRVARNGARSLAVVDGSGTFLGLVPPRDAV